MVGPLSFFKLEPIRTHKRMTMIPKEPLLASNLDRPASYKSCSRLNLVEHLGDRGKRKESY